MPVEVQKSFCRLCLVSAVKQKAQSWDKQSVIVLSCFTLPLDSINLFNSITQVYSLMTVCVKAFSHRTQFALHSHQVGCTHCAQVENFLTWAQGAKAQKRTRHPCAALSSAQTGSLSRRANTYKMNGCDVQGCALHVLCDTGFSLSRVKARNLFPVFLCGVAQLQNKSLMIQLTIWDDYWSSSKPKWLDQTFLQHHLSHDRN